jgi:ribosomal protein S18 acetylase RimI-like enzyme
MPDRLCDNLILGTTSFEEFIRIYCCGKDGVTRGRPFRDYNLKSFHYNHDDYINWAKTKYTTSRGEKKGSFMIFKDKIKIIRKVDILSLDSSDPEDKSLRTFISKCNSMSLWSRGRFYGIYEKGQLASVCCFTRTVKKPYTGNLQLLHTLAKYRRKGYASKLINQSYVELVNGDKWIDPLQYFRVSSEKSAVGFYKSLGFKFQGTQKSGCWLSVHMINNERPTIKNGNYCLPQDYLGRLKNANLRGSLYNVFRELQ